MTPGADWPLGLACMAHALSRDLQRAARAAGGPAALWGGTSAQLAHWLRADTDAVARVTASRAAFHAGSAREALAAAGVTHVGMPSQVYPARLSSIFDPPFGLFGMGCVIPTLACMEEGPTVAIVGSRRPSAAGRRFAHDLAAGLAERGAVIVSGLARGIDGAAHEGALDAGGVTVAVLGSSVDHIHPRRHLTLAQRICETGAVLSEYWPGTSPAAWRFPARNRIVAGLADAVVVVEAAGRSGALITADFAMEHGTTVLAVPGWPGAEMSAGCNSLIRAGAALCEGVDDVVNEVAHVGWRDVQSPLGSDGAGGAVLALIAREPCGVDRIATLTDMPPGAGAAARAALEIAGRVVREPGGVFRAVVRRQGG